MVWAVRMEWFRPLINPQVLLYSEVPTPSIDQLIDLSLLSMMMQALKLHNMKC